MKTSSDLQKALNVASTATANSWADAFSELSTEPIQRNARGARVFTDRQIMLIVEAHQNFVNGAASTRVEALQLVLESHAVWSGSVWFDPVPLVSTQTEPRNNYAAAGMVIASAQAATQTASAQLATQTASAQLATQTASAQLATQTASAQLATQTAIAQAATQTAANVASQVLMVSNEAAQLKMQPASVETAPIQPSPSLKNKVLPALLLGFRWLARNILFVLKKMLNAVKYSLYMNSNPAWKRVSVWVRQKMFEGVLIINLAGFAIINIWLIGVLVGWVLFDRLGIQEIRPFYVDWRNHGAILLYVLLASFLSMSSMPDDKK